MSIDEQGNLIYKKKIKKIIKLLPPLVRDQKEKEHCNEDYEELNHIDKGAFASVFKMRHKRTKQVFAMKRIRKDIIIGNNKEEQVETELKIMYDLDHDNIIKLYTHFEDEEFINLVLEYAPSGTLHGKMKQNKRLDEKTCLNYIKQVFNAIEFIHSKNIIHRDIKPENILLDQINNKIKLADFGASNIIDSVDQFRKTFAGTEVYMAPEILESKQYNQSVDVWSLGCLIYELLTGQLPFHNQDNKDRKEIKLNILNSELEFPNYFPHMAEKLVRKMLERDYQKRISLRDAQKHYWINQSLPEWDVVDPQYQEKLAEEKERKEKNILDRINNFDKDSNVILQTNKLKEKIVEQRKQLDRIQQETLIIQEENQFLVDHVGKNKDKISMQQEDGEGYIPKVSRVFLNKINEEESKIMELKNQLLQNIQDSEETIHKNKLRLENGRKIIENEKLQKIQRKVQQKGEILKALLEQKQQQEQAINIQNLIQEKKEETQFENTSEAEFSNNSQHEWRRSTYLDRMYDKNQLQIQIQESLIYKIKELQEIIQKKNQFYDLQNKLEAKQKLIEEKESNYQRNEEIALEQTFLYEDKLERQKIENQKKMEIIKQGNDKNIKTLQNNLNITQQQTIQKMIQEEQLKIYQFQIANSDRVITQYDLLIENIAKQKVDISQEIADLQFQLNFLQNLQQDKKEKEKFSLKSSKKK